MNGKELFDVINDIDEEYVQELYMEPVRPQIIRIEKKSGGWIRPAIASAACLAVIAGAVGFAKFGGNVQTVGDREYPDGQPDWVYEGAASYNYNVKYPEGSDYPLFVVFDANSPFFSSRRLEDYDEWKYGNFRNLPRSLSSDSEYYKDPKNSNLYNYIYDCMLYHPSYGVWEPVDNSVLCADYVEAPGCEAPAFHSGKVVYAGAASKGNAVIIKHADNDYSLYGYLGELLVKVGDTVDKGQPIATTENVAEADSCHLTLWHGLRAIDISEWDRYIDSRDGLDNKWLPSGWFYSDYMDYLKVYYPETIETDGIIFPAFEGEGPRFYPEGGTLWEEKELGANQMFLQYESNRDLFAYSYESYISEKWGAVGIVTVNNTGAAAALKDGEVVYAGESNYGSVVIVRHGQHDYTLYGYNEVSDGDLKVSVGESVKAGQILAEGNTFTLWETVGEVDVSVWNVFAELPKPNQPYIP